MNILNKNKGFTLLELLVVVGIIAILAAIAMLALSSARSKGGDAGIKSNLHTVRNQAALYFTNNGTFGPIIFNNDCYQGNTNPSGGSMFYIDSVIIKAISKAVIDGGNGDSYCYSDPTTWAAAVALKSNPNYSWCVDSSGKSKQVNSVPALAVNATTHLCNP